MTLSVVALSACDLQGFAKAGHATFLQDTTAESYCRTSANPLSGDQSSIQQDIIVKYECHWEGYDFVVYNAEVPRPYQLDQVYSFILTRAQCDESVYGRSAATDTLIKKVQEWTAKSHNEILVFDRFWLKSKELYQGVQGSDWKDVILDEATKRLLIKDIEGFFDARDTYKRFGIPWKRGIILHGPPGNGKTISIKAIMKSLGLRPTPVPSLYVKSFSSCQGTEQAISQIFQKARQSAPCFLVLEDLDSLVTDKIRSYFLNEVDGLSSNEGILILGSTNHLDKLDPAIVKRPSRFDRKYPFRPPGEPERAAYAAYWKGKLADVPEIDMSDSDCAAIAGSTEGFTFAYLKEAIMATLFQLSSALEDQKLVVDDAGPSVFLRNFQKQVEVLREQMDDAKDAGGETKVHGGSMVNREATHM
ncbi:hypothetical protein MMC18_005045 [Xylographa bjoerkii]|nr:hypothetical protein [Xylographa bjoerkii]